MRASWPWLQRRQEQHQANMPFAFVPLASVQRKANPAGTALFDTLVVVENYPLESGFDAAVDAGLAIGDVQFQDETNYSLTVIASVSADIRLRFGYNRRSFDRSSVERLARQVRTALLAIARADTTTRIESLELLDEAELTLLAHWGEARSRGPLGTPCLRCSRQPPQPIRPGLPSAARGRN